MGWAEIRPQAAQHGTRTGRHGHRCAATCGMRRHWSERGGEPPRVGRPCAAAAPGRAWLCLCPHRGTRPPRHRLRPALQSATLHEANRAPGALRDARGQRQCLLHPRLLHRDRRTGRRTCGLHRVPLAKPIQRFKLPRMGCYAGARRERLALGAQPRHEGDGDGRHERRPHRQQHTPMPLGQG